jgi:hypothetical protein
MTQPPDPRRNAYRVDLAAEHLRECIDAERYAEGERRQVMAPSLSLRRAPRFDAMLDTEALHGETVTVYDEQEGWAWVQLDHDSYVGYVPSAGLAPLGAPPTHRVAALRTYVFPEPDSKVPPLAMLRLNALLVVAEEEGRYLPLASGGFVYASHMAPLGEYAHDFVAVAESFLGAPYLWGGRTSVGLDCSGLVQLAAAAAGYSVPRDADMQAEEVGVPVPDWEREGLKRGDLVFWDGHVGIMTNAEMFIHANAYHMAVKHESFEEARARIEAAGFPVTAVRRLLSGAVKAR